MFGLSFFEIVVIVVVGIIVLGPRRLPTMMRTAGQWVAKLRRLSTDLRAQSGIDDLIRQEGLENEIQELRSLSKINVIDTLITPAAAGAAGAAAQRATVTTPKAADPKPAAPQKAQPLRDREYPVVGCDNYGALPDDVAKKIVPPAILARSAVKQGESSSTKPSSSPSPSDGDAPSRAGEGAAEGDA